MEKCNYLLKIFFIPILVLITLNCAGIFDSRSDATSFSYRFKGKEYRILSGSSANTNQNFNQLLGKDLVAVDLAQDGVIDLIRMGSITLPEAQIIYDYGINLAKESNKLRKKQPAFNHFLEETFDFYYEIITFKLEDGRIYNQFKISRKRTKYPELIAAVDNNADGTLDEMRKGKADLKNLQKKYSSVLKTGLRRGELIRENGMIIVRRK